MKAVVYYGIDDLRVEDVSEPRIEYPTDALIKITSSAICASDLHIKNHGIGESGVAMGHEYCGRIIETGAQVLNLKKGDRVAGKPISSCGSCYYCRRQQESLCEQGGIGPPGRPGSVTGTQAEYARIPFADNTLIKISGDLADEDVIFTGDILSTGLTGILKTHVSLGDTVAVFGCGPVGLCSIACAPLFGAGLVIGVDVLDYRLDVAQKYGAVTINPLREDLEDRIMELTNGRGVDAGIEAAGNESTLRACLKATRRGGEVSILGTIAQPFLFDLSERFFDMFSISIGLGEQNHVPELIELIHRGKLDLRLLITHTYPLLEALTAYEVFEKKNENCIKVILKP